MDRLEDDKERFIGQDVSVMLNRMRNSVIDAEIRKYAEKWYLDFEDVRYEAYHYRDGRLANENQLKDSAGVSLCPRHIIEGACKRGQYSHSGKR